MHDLDLDLIWKLIYIYNFPFNANGNSYDICQRSREKHMNLWNIADLIPLPLNRRWRSWGKTSPITSVDGKLYRRSFGDKCICLEAFLLVTPMSFTLKISSEYNVKHREILSFFTLKTFIEFTNFECEHKSTRWSLTRNKTSHDMSE